MKKKLLGVAVVSSLLLLALGVGVARADTTIGNVSQLGVTELCPFGLPNTATYGQTITSPGGALTSFSFWFTETGSLSADLTYRAEVYQWDPVHSRATGGALWESGNRVVPLGAANPFRADFSIPGGAATAPGVQYVLFVSTSKNWSNTNDTLCMATAIDSSYAKGSYTWINNGGDPSAWTSTSWDNWGGNDLIFQATFSPSVVEPPHAAYCAAKPVLRGDGTTGTFVDLIWGQATSDDYWKAQNLSPAYYVQGLGLTCDIPPGYTDAGYKVDDTGSTAPGEGRIYEYYVKS